MTVKRDLNGNKLLWDPLYFTRVSLLKMSQQGASGSSGGVADSVQGGAGAAPVQAQPVRPDRFLVVERTNTSIDVPLFFYASCKLSHMSFVWILKTLHIRQHTHVRSTAKQKCIALLV